MKIAHVVYQSVPNISGSSTRTKHIITAQRLAGFSPVVISSPCQAPINSDQATGAEVIDDVEYYRTHCFSGVSVGGKSSISQKIKKIIAFPYFVYKLWRFSLKEKPVVLHAHAMFYCALAALIVGRLLNIPTVYEIRSIWYINSNSNQYSLFKRIAISMERFAIRHCNTVIAISDGIKSEFSDIRDDIFIVRNAIQKDELGTAIDDSATFKRFGYIGSVIELEGLDYVINAFASLKKVYPDIQFHIYGGGSKLEDLKRHAEKLGSPTVFHGQVKPSDINSCYRDLDCIINCRNDEVIAQLVTPLKPLEAIALNKALICSNVKGYMEIIGGKENAVVVNARDTSAIIDAVSYVMDDFNRDEIIKKIILAKDFIIENRTWESNMELHIEIYNELLAHTK
ncbi:glycosyltransferase [Pseudoalteromonas sp. SWYJZ98]|uniref:glycosyltransferase family 4 protein n=1 Tax=Pseudoalteromonas sp. SWYJZ98 TaxID=2792060 RepID=UPI0018CCBF79|nr:glycosyltransferase family 4 protein [Pseudoalteromonas sp. SWYJZ98]MBH0029634.1 glycosyltransferase [Pseudoalteromonas sp. SWYJZ98]